MGSLRYIVSPSGSFAAMGENLEDAGKNLGDAGRFRRLSLQRERRQPGTLVGSEGYLLSPGVPLDYDSSSARNVGAF